MSHYAVAVIHKDTQDIDELLAPYDENITVAPYWDWYEKGGRWSGLLKTKDGKKCDEAHIKDLDFSINQNEYNHALRFWDVIVDHAPLEPGEQKSDFCTFYNENYFHEYFLNRENYARINSSFSTYAVITPNGVWHSKGNMGWWGCSSETPEESMVWENEFMERFINNADPDLMITIVDCHI